ncbi:monovalent cation/H(+) antiporter subunit G [Cellulosispirillum alkaliphilum]|uniref:monovalent cation/H(+) antiporter subunit G n=1 Tax=Cellulosispirillum alkaliphilum TaxID=3039283 RepID=UPI003D6DEC57
MGNIGVLIFPDVYTRLQASSTCSTTSVFSFFIAAILQSGLTVISGKIFVLMIFFLISSPVSAHIIGRYAWNKGIEPWRHRSVRKGKGK